MKKLLLITLTLSLTLVSWLSAVEAQPIGMEGLVAGDVQKVGFRAFVLKQAISRNLSGWVVNLPDGRVSFALYGDAERISKAVSQIKEGPEKSTVKSVQTWATNPQGSPGTFTVYAWTSESRDLHTPRDLVFTPRTDGSEISEHDAKKTYHAILHAAGVTDP